MEGEGGKEIGDGGYSIIFLEVKGTWGEGCLSVWGEKRIEGCVWEPWGPFVARVDTKKVASGPLISGL